MLCQPSSRMYLTSDPSEGMGNTDPAGAYEELWKSMRVILRETRVTRRIAMRALAAEMGVHFSHLSRMERGVVVPSVTLAFRWCQALGLDFDSLYRFGKERDAPADHLD